MILSQIKSFSLHQQKQGVRKHELLLVEGGKTPPNKSGDKIKTKTMNKHSPIFDRNRP